MSGSSRVATLALGWSGCLSNCTRMAQRVLAGRATSNRRTRTEPAIANPGCAVTQTVQTRQYIFIPGDSSTRGANRRLTVVRRSGVIFIHFFFKNGMLMCSESCIAFRTRNRSTCYGRSAKTARMQQCPCLSRPDTLEYNGCLTQRETLRQQH